MRQRRTFGPGAGLVGVSLLAVSLAGCEGELSTDVPSAESFAAEDALPSEPMTPEPPASLLVSPEDVDTLFQSGASGFAESGRSVVRSVEAWDEAWTQLTGLIRPTPTAPEVDFSTHQVVVVAMGERPSGGHAIGVAQIEQQQDTVFVSVVETSPGPGCITTQEITRPVMAISMPMIDAPVAFAEQVVIQNCS